MKRAVATRDGLLEVLRTGRVLAIALVDLRLLHARAARTSLLPRSYTGHYVLLVGAEGDRVRYRDPAADRAPARGGGRTLARGQACSHVHVQVRAWRDAGEAA